MGDEGLRVLYLIDSLVPSGAERSLAALAPAYADRGVELHVAYLQERAGLQEELRAAGAEVVSLAGPGGRLGWIRRARQVIRSRRPDLIHTTLAEADLAGRIAGRLSSVPVVSSLVNLQHAPEQFADPSVAPWKRRAARLADRVTARSVVRFHAITEYIADTMSGILRIPRDRIDVVPRGRPAEGLGSRTPERRARARASLGLDDHAPLLLSVARQDRQKGLDVLLRALPAVVARFPEARVALVGRDGGMTPELHAIVDRLGLREPVMFLGLRDDVPELLCAADVFVFPSRWEGLGSVLLEAMAVEAPIVATDIPPIREAVAGHGDVASLVPVEDEAALAEAVVETLGDRAGSAERAAAGRRRFLERFTISSVADGMVAFYRRALVAYRGSVGAMSSRPDRLRVLHVLATNQRRGGETYAADLVRGLSGHDVDQRVAVLRGVEHRQLRFHAPAGVVGGGPRLPGVGIDLGAVRRLRRISSRWRPHVVHAHGGEPFKHAALAAGPGGAALVCGRIGAAWIGSGPRAWGYGRLMRRADRVFALAEALTRETVEVFGVPEDRVLTMPGGVDESFVRPTRGRDATREELAIPQDARVILSLGALAWEKDPLGHLDVAARALEKVPDAVYVVAGEGPLRPALEEEVRDRRLGDRVRVVGARSDVGDLLASADVLLLASRFEGVPRVVLEAGMVGVPSAAYAVAGIPETVESGETGLLAPPGDAEALAVATVSLLTDDGLRRRLGETARQRYRARFAADVVARAHLAVYRELAAAR